MKKRSVDSTGFPLPQILTGITMALIAALVAACLVAYLIGKGTVDEGNMKLIMVLMNLVAGLVGSLVAVLSAKRSILIVAISVAAGYFLLLLCGNFLFVEGGLDGALWSLAMIMVGSGAAILVGLRGFHTKNQKNLRMRKL